MRTAAVSIALLTAACFAACFAACSKAPATDGEPAPCAAQGITFASRFSGGSPDGHPDPAGARAAKQARAARIRDPKLIRQPADARSPVREGDFLLVNDRLGVYVAGARPTDGYGGFGGRLLALEPVGDDGLPVGVSTYGETLIAISKQAVFPESVSVLADGSDGGAAIVRVAGRLTNLPFLTVLPAFPYEYDFPAALDFVLAPGSDKIALRLSLMNPHAETIDLSQRHAIGFFHTSRAQLFVDGNGFDMPGGEVPWVAFDGGRYGFAVRLPGGPLRFVFDISGFQYFSGNAIPSLPACATQTSDYVDFIGGGPDIDGIRAAIRRVDGDATWREVRGQVVDGGGAPIPGAQVHAVGEGGKYVTRATADAQGKFALHAPPSPVSLQATQRGFAMPAPVEHRPGAPDPMMRLASSGTIVVHAREAATKEPLPVRVQVIPSAPPAGAPARFGVADEVRDRLHQEFAITGEARLVVPPGEHTVIVTRGYEYELHTQKVTVEAGKSATVDAALAHSVDTGGVMCADFHIHSFYSADSSDPVDFKVKGAVADGLDIPVSSEHEYVIDFQPTIEKLGLSRWARGIPSEELTTFVWGHFGVVPLLPRPELPNRGALPWIGKTPDELFRSVEELPEQPVLIINHPSGGSIGGYFSSAKLDRATGKGVPDLWSERFGAVEVFNDSDLEENRERSVADWFALLDAGKIVWAVGSSDSHGLRTSPVGYPRTCMKFGHDDPRKVSPESVRDALKSGASIVSGGLFLAVSGPGGVGPGGMLAAGAPPTFHVVVQAPRWLGADVLEAIVDGESAKTVELQEQQGAPGAARRYEADVTVAGRAGRALHWVVFHARTRGKDLSPLHPGRRPFAVSNPIFF